MNETINATVKAVAESGINPDYVVGAVIVFTLLIIWVSTR